MSNHYDLFVNENEIVLTKLVQTYLSYYKIKKEFLEARDSFFEELYNAYPEYKKKRDEDKRAIIEEQEKEREKDEQKNENENEEHKIIEEKENKIINEEENKVIEEEEENSESKKCSNIFHKIALQTHPDKKQNINPEYFQQAQKANEKGKVGKLYFIGKYLQIQIGDLTVENIQDIQNSIEKKEKKIEHYKKTYPYVYKQTENEEVRKRLLEAFHKIDEKK
jgi:hypothetical protein